MHRLRPVHRWIRALWLGLALLLPLHAAASGLGWCPMAAAALVTVAGTDTGDVPCASHAGPVSMPGQAAADADAGGDRAGSAGACLLCAAHAGQAAGWPALADWTPWFAPQHVAGGPAGPAADFLGEALERPPRG